MAINATRCSLPGLTGTCEAIIGRYYHIAGECVYFTWSGCGGNANRFETLSECQKTCLGVDTVQTLYDADTMSSNAEDPKFQSYHIIIAFVAIYVVICILGVSYFVTYQRKSISGATVLPDDEISKSSLTKMTKSKSNSKGSSHDSQRTECIQTQSVSMSFPAPPPRRIPSLKTLKPGRVSTNPFDNLSPTFRSVDLPKSLGRRASAGIAARKLSQNHDHHGISQSPSSRDYSIHSPSFQSTLPEKQQFLHRMAQSLSPRGGRRNRYQLQLNVGEEETDHILDDGAEQSILVSRLMSDEETTAIDGGVEMTQHGSVTDSHLEAIIAKKEEFFATNPITPKTGRTCTVNTNPNNPIITGKGGGRESITNHGNNHNIIGDITETPPIPITPKVPITPHRSIAMTPSLVRKTHSPRLTVTIEGDTDCVVVGDLDDDVYGYRDGDGDGDRDGDLERTTTVGNEETHDRRRSTTVNTLTTLSMAAVDSEFFSGDYDPNHDPMKDIVPESSSSEHLIEDHLPTGSQIDALQGLMTKLDEEEHMMYDMNWQLRANKPKHEYTTVMMEPEEL